MFLHWRVPQEQLLAHLPAHRDLRPDILDGAAWVSLVCFKVQHARLRLLPSLPGLSSFYEINLRTYVVCNGKPGVVFLDIHSDNAMINRLNRLVHLPYRKGYVRSQQQAQLRYTYADPEQNVLDIHFTRLQQPVTDTDRWLTERYIAFQQAGRTVWDFSIHHVQWPLQTIALSETKIAYRWKNLFLSDKELAYAQFSPGVDTLLWRPVKTGL